MTETRQTEGYRGIYLERSGESALQLAEILVAPPDFPLDDQQLAEAHIFENEIFTHEFVAGTTTEMILRGGRSEDLVAPLVFTQAFLEGIVDLSHLPEGLRAEKFYSSDDVFKWFSELASDSTVDVSTLLQIAKDSRQYYTEQVAVALQQGEEILPQLERSMAIVLDPTVTLEHAKEVLTLREYLLTLRSQYREGGDRLEGAKRAIIDVYTAKVNAACVTSFVRLDYLNHQAAIAEDKELSEKIKEEMPFAFFRALSNDQFHNRALQRLDYLENGMGQDEIGAADAVSEKLYQMAVNDEREVTLGEPVFTAEETARLKEVELPPEQVMQIISNVLRKVSLFSSEDSSSWFPGRKHRAGDELFQVVINPGKDSFAVDGKSGVYLVSSVPRSLYDVLVVAGIHELSHINQTQSDIALSHVIRLAALKGKRVSMLREGGANAKQRSAEVELFGRAKPIALTYAKAYKTLHDTGSTFEASKTFYEEKLRIMPNVNRKTAAKEAADRVLRLKRGGGFSSGALSYGEEGIFAAELQGAPDLIIDRAMAITTFDLQDQVRLHRYGLLPEAVGDPIDWTTLIIYELKPYIQNALKNIE